MSETREPSAPPDVLPFEPPVAVPVESSASSDTAPLTAAQAGAEAPTLSYAGRGDFEQCVWRQGKLLVASLGAPLPNRCIKCNAPAEGRPLKRRLSWHHPAIYLLVLAALLAYVIVALILRKQAVVEFGLCARHRARRRWAVAICWLFVLGSVGLLFLAAIVENLAFAALACVSVVTGLLVYLFGGQPVTPYRIDDHAVWLRGVCADYLSTLPPSPWRI
ncbi:MAG: hypothetical protein JXQ75_22670 [Phycisphaerae bacterium]|nr:hypothetical protein [Phycisphaerae bacterium]